MKARVGVYGLAGAARQAASRATSTSGSIAGLGPAGEHDADITAGSSAILIARAVVRITRIKASATANLAGERAWRLAVSCELDARRDAGGYANLVSMNRVVLRDGAGVTDPCFAVGFGSLSHFVTTSRRRYGIRPSDIRRGVAGHPPPARTDEFRG